MVSLTNIGRPTLLEMTQTVLEKMDSDEVNSIFDTVESRAVAGEIRDSFRQITANSEDYQEERYVTLEVLAEAELFNQLRLPSQVLRLEDFWLIDEYKCRVCPEWMEPKEFVDHIFNNDSQNSHNDNTVYVPAAGTKSPCFPVRTDCKPCFYTSFDGQHIFLDSLDLRNRMSLAEADIGARVVSAIEFKMEDDFLIPLNADEIPFLLNEAIDASFVHFKGVSNSKAQRRAREQKVMKQNNRERIGRQTSTLPFPPYGRHARGRKV